MTEYTNIIVMFNGNGHYDTYDGKIYGYVIYFNTGVLKVFKLNDEGDCTYYSPNYWQKVYRVKN